MTSNYEPFGEEWKKEMSKLPKSVIINIAAKIGKEKDTDLCEFAEWCSLNDWFFVKESNMWYNKIKTLISKTTSQLREDWEIETGRRKRNEKGNIGKN